MTHLCNTLPGDIYVFLRTTFPLPGTHCNTKFDLMNISLPWQLAWFPPVPNNHWFERQSGVNSHRLNLEVVRIQFVKSGWVCILSYSQCKLSDSSCPSVD